MHPDLLTRAFPYLAAVLAAVAVTDPDLFLPWREAVVPLLGVVMLGMGLTLSAESFAAVARRPALVALGVGLQFLVMPLAGWLLALLFRSRTAAFVASLVFLLHPVQADLDDLLATLDAALRQPLDPARIRKITIGVRP